MEEKVINIIYQALQVESDVEITANTQLSDLLFDSIDFVQMVVSLENEFNFEFDDEKLILDQFSSVESVIEYVKSKLNHHGL